LESAIRDLQALQQILLSGDLDAGILSDFRDALNSIRNTAWAAQQLVASQVSEQGPEGVMGLLASERVRAAYQLCRTIGSDLGSDGMQFQKGQLAELHSVVTELARQIKDKLETS